jgi:hypothetical protein
MSAVVGGAVSYYNAYSSGTHNPSNTHSTSSGTQVVTNKGGLLGGGEREREREREREAWKRERLSNFDNAMQTVIDSPPHNSSVQDAVVREGFLKFFVAIFKDYKK